MVIPTLGRRLPTLERALKSILDQADISIDTIIVSKAVTPELCQIAARYNARVIQNDGHISEAVNAGLSAASTSHGYMAWLGDDDLYRPDSLATARARLDLDPMAVVCFGSCDYVDFDCNLLFNRRPPPFAPTLLQFIPGLIKQEACLFRLSAVRSLGGLDPTLRFTMDLDLLLRLRHLGRFVRTNRTLAAFCWHPDSLTIANRKSSLDEAQIVQGRHARGLAALIFLLAKQPIRRMILFLSARISSKHHQADA